MDAASPAVTVTLPSDREVAFTRVFDAPRELLWRAWTDPRHMARWFGPRGFTVPVCEMDLRVGGAWRIVMRAPDCAEYPATGTFREIARPERLVTSLDVSEHPREWHELVNKNRGAPPDARVSGLSWIVTFEALCAKTRLTVVNGFASRADRDGFIATGMKEGWGQSLDRLAELSLPGDG